MSTSGIPVPAALGNSTGSEDRELQREGRQLLFAIHSAMRALRLYPLENQAVQNALAELERAAAKLLAREPEVTLRHVGEFFFVNDLRLRLDLATFATFGALGRSLQGHGVGQVEIYQGVARADWVAGLLLLLGDPDPHRPFAKLTERLTSAGVFRLSVGERPGEETDADADRSRDTARRMYAQTVSVVREVMSAGRMGRGVSLRRVKRAVQSMVDQVLTNQTSIVGMTTLRDYDQYTFTHSVNVCIFSVALGKRLGFGKRELYELGLCALMHDVGKSRLPLEVLNKSATLDTDEWALLQQHPTEGLLALFTMRGFSEPPLRAMLAAYEHHMGTDGQGYPRSRRPRSRSLFARMIAVADSFDAGTTQRVYMRAADRPDQVLKEMRDNPNRGLDPLLVRAFISMTGIYPTGSLVVLDSYELAVVMAPHPDPEGLHEPTVRIIFSSLGVPVDPPRTVDLSERDPASGAPRRSIIKTTDPERYGIHVGDYLA
ncbi:MAG: HD domain-containing protein [Gemmatimonadota bacterium]|nr:HD domain-containing protein [Gemmatimonadota bacterium]